MYSQAIPLMTPDRLDSIRRQLPELVLQLSSMKDQPSRRAAMLGLISSMGYEGGERSPGSGGEIVVRLMTEDVGSGERIIPLIMLGIAAFALGYNIGHTWGT